MSALPRGTSTDSRAPVPDDQPDCASCRLPMDYALPFRRSRGLPFHVDCPSPHRSRDGQCSVCRAISSLAPLDASEREWFFPRHWRETPAQRAVRVVTGLVLEATGRFVDLWDFAQRVLSTPRGGVPSDEWSILWQKEECPGSYLIPERQREAGVSKGQCHSGPNALPTKPTDVIFSRAWEEDWDVDIHPAKGLPSSHADP